MTHIVYYEPCYSNEQQSLWQLRGEYKYPSILGDLGKRARLTILQHVPPPRSDPQRKRLETEFGVEFARFRQRNSPGAGRAERLARGLAVELKRLGADVVSNLNGRSIIYCYATAHAALAANARYVMRIGGNDLLAKEHVYRLSGRPFAGTQQYYNLVLQERLAAQWANSIIVMNRLEQARLARITHDPEKISVCYRGVDPDMFFSDKPRKGPCRRFLFIGRKSFEKGYDILEDAAKCIWQERPELSFTFAGTFEKEKTENRNYIGFVGFDDLPDLYREHDALIVSSRSEGLPQVVMEAMSMGMPCILSRHLFDLDFEDKKNVLLCDCTAEDLVKKINLFATRGSKLYSQISREALSYARENFAAPALNQRYQSIVAEG